MEAITEGVQGRHTFTRALIVGMHEVAVQNIVPQNTVSTIVLKGKKYICHLDTILKKARVVTLILNKLDF